MVSNDKYILEIPTKKYVSFCNELEQQRLKPSDFTFFKDASTCLLVTEICHSLFLEEIAGITSLLNDPYVGIAAVDVPQTPLCDNPSNSIYGAAVISGVFNNIGIPNIDPMNKTPFAIHTASHSNAERLDERGLEYYTPEVKLGFHNDGLLTDEKIQIPNHIAVYNLYINYRNPGNFMWIPTASWVGANKYATIAKNESIAVKIRLTPSYYLDDAGEIKNSVFDLVEAPLSSFNERGEYRFFLNGQVLLEHNRPEHVKFVKSVRDSLQNNPQKICIPQKERRAFFLKNTLGFHARDVFEEPIEGVDLTRVFIRAVDLNAETYVTY